MKLCSTPTQTGAPIAPGSLSHQEDLSTPDQTPVLDRRSSDRGLGGRILTIEEQLIHGAGRMDKHEKLLAENTAATKEVLEIVTLAKSFFKVLGHIGSSIKWVAGLAASAGAIWSFWPHGTPPK